MKVQSEFDFVIEVLTLKVNEIEAAIKEYIDNGGKKDSIRYKEALNKVEQFDAAIKILSNDK